MLCRCAWDTLSMFLHEALDQKDVFPGGILVPQTFGGMANWNPHTCYLKSLTLYKVHILKY